MCDRDHILLRRKHDPNTLNTHSHKSTSGFLGSDAELTQKNNHNVYIQTLNRRDSETTVLPDISSLSVPHC